MRRVLAPPRPSGPAIEQDDGNDSARLGRIVAELGSLLGVLRPEPLAFGTLSDLRGRLEGLAPGLDGDRRVGDQVVVPGRIRWRTALAGGDHVSIAIARVGHHGGPRLPG